MRVKITLLYMAGALLLFLFACSPRPPHTDIIVTCADFEKQPNIDAAANTPLPAGKPFTVSLCADTSAGIQWNNTVIINDETVVKESTHQLYSGQEVWTFNALKAGHTTLTFSVLPNTAVRRSFGDCNNLV